MQKNKKSVLFLAQAGITAALYFVLTLLANALGIGSMAVQFRFSEVLTVLPVLTPAAVPGLAVGCFLGNLTSPLGVIDWVFGTLATLLGAVLCRALRKIRFRGLPLASAFMAVLSNAVIVAFEISCLSSANAFAVSNFNAAVFFTTAGTVALGEVVMCVGGGLLLFHALEKSKAASRLFEQHS